MTVWTESLCSFPSLIKFCFVSVDFYLTQFFNSAPFNPLSYTHACLPDSNFVCLSVCTSLSSSLYYKCYLSFCLSMYSIFHYYLWQSLHILSVCLPSLLYCSFSLCSSLSLSPFFFPWRFVLIPVSLSVWLVFFLYLLYLKPQNELIINCC